ncbi:MAG: UV DNA damage repair endonuclease UvsE, partial [Myxococcaceae bacterium]
ELSYSTRVLDLLEQGPEARVVVHVGGAAPDRSVALAAAHRFLDESPRDVLWRVAVEHDDRIWSAREVLPLAREHGLPFVADNLHNAVLESDPPMPLHELIREAGRTWHALGLRPKYHLASQARNHRAGAHADRIHPEDARAFLDALSHPADLMLEAKEKELALFALRRDCGLEGEALALR